MKVVSIGKGMNRIIVRSREKRARLSIIPEVIVDGNRVIFPDWLLGNIKIIIEPSKKKKKPNIVQDNLL
ncbi:hypothetical protein ACFL50_05175 [Candidatus Latescibacterota bacterium]